MRRPSWSDSAGSRGTNPGPLRGTTRTTMRPEPPRIPRPPRPPALRGRAARPEPEPSAPPADEVPDRPLDAPDSPPTVAVRSAGHHPFVYRKMVVGPVGPVRPRDGDLVR